MNPRPLPGHGTLSRYKHRKDPCRCDRCTRANREYQASRREGRPLKGRHGTRHRYNQGCRCRWCRAVHSAYQAGYQAGQRQARKELIEEGYDESYGGLLP